MIAFHLTKEITYWNVWSNFRRLNIKEPYLGSYIKTCFKYNIKTLKVLKGLKKIQVKDFENMEC
jgi:hypothetical protein